MYMARRIFLFFCLLCVLPVNSQLLMKGSISTLVSVSSDQIKPLWNYSNSWGLVDPSGQADIYVKANGEVIFLNKENLVIESGLGVVVPSYNQNSIIHELYLSGSVYFIDYVLGKKAYSPLDHYDDLGTGSYLMSSNARPIPRISLGIFDYKTVPFSKGWLQVKGMISQGFLNEDPEYGRVGKVLLHEKYAFLRINKFFIKPYAGLVHSALFGGEYSDGSKIPVDFWATFCAKGSELLGGGELTNAAGAHEGFWDFGIDANTVVGKMHLGLNKPFTDRNGYALNKAFRLNHDFILLFDWEPVNFKFIDRIVLEFFKTDHQSGEGIPDPLFPEGFAKDPSRVGQMIFPWLIDDWDSFMAESFVGIPTPEGGWNEELFNQYWITNFNHGHYYGGRGDNFNNSMYYRGYSYMGQSLGTPLFHTKSMVMQYAPGWQPNNYGFFINNRVRAFNVGIQGPINEQWKYSMKFTCSLNNGSWAEKYYGRYSWILAPDYFFEKTKQQFYSHIEVFGINVFKTGLDFKGAVGFDFGELYRSFGLNIGINYKF